MKILYFSSPFFADCDFPLIKEYQRKGVDVTYVISLTPYSLKSTLFNIKEQPKENGLIHSSQIPEICMYSNYMNMNNVFILNRRGKKDSSFGALKNVWNLIRFIKKYKYDIVHIVGFQSMWNLFLYVFLKNKVVLTVHDPFPHYGEGRKIKIFYRKFATSILRKFVLLNENQKEKFCLHYGICEKDVLINRLGVYDNIRYFANNSVNSDDCKVLFFGRISPYKGVEYLCQAMLKVKSVVPNASLVIAGGGNFYFDVEKYRTLDWIEFRNRFITMEELSSLLQQCSITVCPYVDASQSGVIMTSYSFCKPVVASNVGGLGEMIDECKSGLLVPPKNVDALADAIIKLLLNKELRNEMSAYIERVYYNGCRSWSSIAEQYLNFYRCDKK